MELVAVAGQDRNELRCGTEGIKATALKRDSKCRVSSDDLVELRNVSDENADKKDVVAAR
jgi:hypothetical protein